MSGANRSIGRTITKALLPRGARKVYAGVRSPARLADLGDRVVVLPLDITDPAQVEAAAEVATDLDLLINNAGVAESGGTEFDDPRQLAAGRREMAVNVQGTYRMTQAFAPVLARNGGGAVVNVVSIAALVNFPLFVSYTLSKAALHSLTQATRLQLKVRRGPDDLPPLRVLPSVEGGVAFVDTGHTASARTAGRGDGRRRVRAAIGTDGGTCPR